MKTFLKFLLIIAVILGAAILVYDKFSVKDPVTPEPIANPDEEPIINPIYKNASADLIQVELPYPGAVTGKEFKIIGKARGYWFFEASFPIELTDPNGKVLAVAIAQADGEWMTEEFVNFSVDMKAPTDYIGPATLTFKRDNPSGLPENDASMSFPITVEY